MTLAASLGGASVTAQSSSPAPSLAGPATPITVGTIPVNTAIPVYVALNQGFFDEVGLDVTTVLTSNFQASLASVLNGEYSFGLAANVPLLVSASKGAPIRLVAQTATVTPAIPDMVLVMPDSEIAGAKDLEGKKVAVVALSTPQEIGVREAVRQAGGDASKVQFLELPSAQMIAALNAGTVDAIAATVPWVSIGTAQGLKPVFSYASGVYPEGSIWAGYFASSDFIAANEDIVRRFQSAMTKATNFAAENPDAARATLHEFTEMDDEVINMVQLGTFSPVVDIAANEELQRVLESYGIIGTPVDIPTFFYNAQQ